MHWLVIIGIALVLLYFAAAAALYFFQRTFIYFPAPVVNHPFDEQIITVDAERGIDLRVVVVNPGQSHAVLYFGGNAESVAHSAGELAAALPQHTLYLVNYRGYGGSAGKPAEVDLFSDAEKVFDGIAAQHTSVAAIGRSLGSGVVCWLASRRALVRVILVTPFDSVLKIAQSAYPVFPVRWLLRDRYESLRYAPAIMVPVLVLLAADDTVIPYGSSLRLVQSLATVDSRLLNGVGHNDLQIHRDYYPAITEFLDTDSALPVQ